MAKAIKQTKTTEIKIVPCPYCGKDMALEGILAKQEAIIFNVTFDAHQTNLLDVNPDDMKILCTGFYCASCYKTLDHRRKE